MTFKEIKEEWCNAMRVHDGCNFAYKLLLEAQTVPQMLRVAQDYWDEIYRSKYPEVVLKRIETWYCNFKEDFNSAGVFVNEPSDWGLVIVNNYYKEALNIYGKAKAYIFGKSYVKGYDSAQVYCRTEGSLIELYNTSYGHVEAGRAVAYGRSSLQCNCDAECYGSVKINIYGGVLKDYGHLYIMASGNAVVYSSNSRNINISGNAKIKNL